MTIKDAINYGHKILSASSCVTARFDAELLLAFVLQKNREFLLTYPEKNINFWQSLKFKYLTKRRAKNEPVAYLVGQKDFFGLNFVVNKNVLVPRPETELMVEEIIEIVKEKSTGKIIDLGTGSGCIISSLAKNLENNFKFFASDISRPALKIAKKNAQLNRVHDKIIFKHGNLLKPFIDDIVVDDYLIISSNLPYLSPEQIKNSPSIQKEPYLALEAGEDGLRYYRELFAQIVELKNGKNISGFCLCEIDPIQKDSIGILVKSYFDTNFTIKNDLAGLSRLAIIEI